MKRFVVVNLIFIAVFSLVAAADLRAESGASKIEDSIDVLKDIMAIPEKNIPPALLRNASGIAIIPGVIKAGFVLGGRYGTGILVVKDRQNKWSNPAFITLAGGSIGWQIGVESIDIILVFKSEKSINRLVSGKFTLGADASVAAGPVGREAAAATDVQLKSEIYSYSRSRGLFAGLALSGASMHIDDGADEHFYGRRYMTARDIFSGRELKVPHAADRLKKLLTDYTL